MHTEKKTRNPAVYVSLIITISVLTGVSNAAQFFYAKSRLEAMQTQVIAFLESRLQKNLPEPLWQMNHALVDTMVSAEMDISDLPAVEVYDQQGLVLALGRDKEGRIVPQTPPEKHPGLLLREIPITYSDGSTSKPIGMVKLFMDQDLVAILSRGVVILTVIQLVVLNVLGCILLNVLTRWFDKRHHGERSLASAPMGPP